jgi:hypothetical protein
VWVGDTGFQRSNVILRILSRRNNGKNYIEHFVGYGRNEAKGAIELFLFA